MSTWQAKVRDKIGELSLKSYRDANTPKGKRHKPYNLPDTVVDLVDCLNKNDEERAKAILIYRYEAQ